MQRFFDTNILLYQYDASAPHKQFIADALIKETVANDELVVSTQVMMEFYHVATRKYSRQISAAHLGELMHELAEWNPVVVTPDLINEAVLLHRIHQFSWWDSTIVAAAVRAEADILYSEDLQHGREIDGLRIQNPFISRVSEPHRKYRPRSKR